MGLEAERMIRRWPETSLSAVATRTMQEPLTGEEILKVLGTKSEVPRPFGPSAATVDSMLLRANINPLKVSDSRITAEQLREIVDWALRGVCHWMKFPSDLTNTEPKAAKFFEIAQLATNYLRARGEGYGAEMIETADPFAGLRNPGGL